MIMAISKHKQRHNKISNIDRDKMSAELWDTSAELVQCPMESVGPKLRLLIITTSNKLWI